MKIEPKNRLIKAIKDPKYVTWKLQTDIKTKLAEKLKKNIFYKFMNASERGNIALFHIGRSGSTVLGDLLGQHPEIYWDGEIFKHYLSHKFPLKLLRQRMVLSGKNSFYGFEVKFFHIKSFGMKTQQFINDIERMGVNRFIVLERTNYLRKIISSVKASTTDSWHQPAGVKATKTIIDLDPAKVSIDNKSKPLIDFLNEYKDDFTELRICLKDRPHLWLTYEDDIQNNPVEAYNKIIKDIGLKEKKVNVRYGKTNPFSIDSVVKNYEGIENVLKETEFEWMLT